MTGAHTAPRNTAIAEPVTSNDESANVTPNNVPIPAAEAVQKTAGKTAAINTPKSFAVTSLAGANADVTGKVRVVAAVMIYSAS